LLRHGQRRYDEQGRALPNGAFVKFEDGTEISACSIIRTVREGDRVKKEARSLTYVVNGERVNGLRVILGNTRHLMVIIPVFFILASPVLVLLNVLSWRGPPGRKR